jgi:hypothetical protein
VVVDGAASVCPEPQESIEDDSSERLHNAATTQHEPKRRHLGSIRRRAQQPNTVVRVRLHKFQLYFEISRTSFQLLLEI